MFSRRTRARIDFVTSVLSLVFNVVVRRRFATSDGSSSVRPEWLVAGGAYEMLSCWAYDTDFRGTRTSRLRRGLLAAVRSLFGLGLALGVRSFSDSQTARQDFSLGRSCGHVGYRLWYGVLRPLPGTDD
jgi:hypothetical protein